MDYEEDGQIKQIESLAEKFSDLENGDTILLKQILTQLKEINEKIDQIITEKK